LNDPIIISTGHLDAPWIAAHLAVLNEAALDVRLYVNFQALTAERTGHEELVWHRPRSYRGPRGTTWEVQEKEVFFPA
jgi:hypothetical protein